MYFEDLLAEAFELVDGFDYFLPSDIAVHPRVRASCDTAGTTINVELPGCSIDDVEVSTAGRKFSVKTKENIKPRVDYSLAVHNQFDLDKAEASMKNGLLVVKIPYTEGKTTRKIEVKNGV